MGPDCQRPIGSAAAEGDGDPVDADLLTCGIVGIISGGIFITRGHTEGHVLGIVGIADLRGVSGQGGIFGLGDGEGEIVRFRHGKAHQFTKRIYGGSGLDLRSPAGDRSGRRCGCLAGKYQENTGGEHEGQTRGRQHCPPDRVAG